MSIRNANAQIHLRQNLRTKTAKTPHSAGFNFHGSREERYAWMRAKQAAKAEAEAKAEERKRKSGPAAPYDRHAMHWSDIFIARKHIDNGNLAEWDCECISCLLCREALNGGLQNAAAKRFGAGGTSV
jgi:hypothetical protein